MVECLSKKLEIVKHVAFAKLHIFLGLGHNVQMVYQEQDGQTALHAAAFSGHLAVIHIILQCGATLDKLDHSQNSPLSLALIQGHNDIVKYLIQSGSSVSLKVFLFFTFVLQSYVMI